ncbi:unnamed protein product, partial [marine sediment metagenome]
GQYIKNARGMGRRDGQFEGVLRSWVWSECRELIYIDGTGCQGKK